MLNGLEIKSDNVIVLKNAVSDLTETLIGIGISIEEQVKEQGFPSVTLMGIKAKLARATMTSWEDLKIMYEGK